MSDGTLRRALLAFDVARKVGREAVRTRGLVSTVSMEISVLLPLILSYAESGRFHEKKERGMKGVLGVKSVSLGDPAHVLS